jgi:hypothetical protein
MRNEIFKRARLQAAFPVCSLKVSVSRSLRIASAKSARIISLDQNVRHVVCFGLHGTAAACGDAAALDDRQIASREPLSVDM